MLKILWRDKSARLALLVVLCYVVLALCVYFKFIGYDWDEFVSSESFSPMSSKYWFGTNLNGQSVFSRVVYSTKSALELGAVVCFFSIMIGSIFGSVCGFYHDSWADKFVVWVFSSIDCIPFYLLSAAIAFVFKDNDFSIYLALIFTLWTSVCKAVRGQVMKIKNMEFIDSARVLGRSDKGIIIRHILPNLTPILLVEASLVFVTAIKAEVVLSFLGLGAKDGVTWGLMLAESASEVTAGIFNNFLAASLFMICLIVSFNHLLNKVMSTYLS